MPCCSRGGCSLYYEFYIDQFFLEQVITQGLLLLLASKTAGKHLTCRRLGAGSLIGAGMMTLFLCAGSRALAFSGSLMAGSAALAGKKWREIPRDLAILLFVTLCFGGVVQAAVELTGAPAAAGSCAAFFLLHFAGKKPEGTQALPEAGSGSKNYMGERKHDGKRNRRYGKQSAGTAWQKSGQHPGSGSGREASAGRMGDTQRVLPDSVSFDRAEKRMDACISGG